MTTLTNEYPAFSDVESALRKSKLAISAAEVHGIIASSICIGADENNENWIIHILDGQNLDELLRSQLQPVIDLYKQTFAQLNAMDFAFELFIPDTADLNMRAMLLSRFCDGFLSGLGLAGFDIDAIDNEDIQNILQHMSEISQLDFASIESGDADEKAFIEIKEYIRMAVIMIYTEHRAGELEGGQGSQTNSLLH